MKKLHLDFETRCALDIKVAGLDNYARKAEVLMLAYARDGAHPSVWFPHEGAMPAELSEALRDEATVLCAWNASFERAIFRHTLGFPMPIARWLDPSVIARYAGLPSRLKDVSKVMDMGAEAKSDGMRLIRKFSMPKKDGTFRDWQTDPDDWKLFADYCIQDVVAERAIMNRLAAFIALPARERALWELDQHINDRGIPVDIPFVKSAYGLAEREREKLAGELKGITGLENPNSVKQILGWLRTRGYPFESVGAKRIQEALA